MAVIKSFLLGVLVSLAAAGGLPLVVFQTVLALSGSGDLFKDLAARLQGVGSAVGQMSANHVKA